MLFLSVNQVGSGQLSVTALKWKKGLVLSTGPLTTLVYTHALLYLVISFIASFDFHMKLFYVLLLCICIYPITNKGLDKGGIQYRCKFFRIILEFRILRLTFR